MITGNENKNPSNTELASNTVNDISTSYTSITTTNASTSSNISTSDLNENNEMITVNENENPSNTENTSNTENVPILDPNDIPSIQECIDTIKDGSLPPISLGQHPSTKVLQEKFNNFMYNQSVHHCHYCKERWYGLDGEINNENNFECKKCISDMKKNVMQIRTLSSENDLDPKIESMYHLLPELNDIEEMFITRVHVVMKVFQIGNGNIGYKGNVLNIEQDIQPVINKLPLIPSEMPIFVCRKSNPNSPSGYKDFNVNRDKILRWLVWLKENNRNYRDIIIDFDALNNLPIDGSIYHDLRSYSLEDEAEEDGSLEAGPDQSNATGPLPDEDNIHVSQNYACINPLLQSESNDESITRLLNEAMGTADNPLPFPAQLDRLNDYTYPSIQSLAFPLLFLYGAGDVTFRDRNITVSLTDSNRHLLKYSFHDPISDSYVYPFAKHDRWMHWAQNTAERHRVLIYYFSYSKHCMTMQKLFKTLQNMLKKQRK